MNVILIGNKTLHKLKLPSQVEGSFFLTDPNDTDNLLSVDADNNGWLVKANEETKIIDLGNNFLSSCRLNLNDFYFIEYKNNKKIIYVSETYDNTSSIYQIKGDFTL